MSWQCDNSGLLDLGLHSSSQASLSIVPFAVSSAVRTVDLSRCRSQWPFSGAIKQICDVHVLVRTRVSDHSKFEFAVVLLRVVGKRVVHLRVEHFKRNR